MASKFHLKTAKDGQFHFNLLAGNGEIILASELYKSKPSALNGIESVQKNAQREGAFEVKPAAAGKFHFVLKATNARWLARASYMPAKPAARTASRR